jgi:hypothetical protein
MKLSEIKGDRALDVMADLIDPIASIMSDKELVSAMNSKLPTLLIAKKILKSKKKEIITILALLNDEDVNTFEPNLLLLPKMLIDLLSDKELMELFQSARQNLEGASFGLAMESTQETEEM